MLKMVRAFALTLMLAVGASAGESPNNVTDEPASPPAPIKTWEPDEGAALLQEPAADSFGETFLSLIGSVLALF